ncbi:MAG: hypothetical protein OH354_01260 [Candidatus Parvarchaeota archaeon]|nr:hypothetical protein [Candidatus Jingweiarchaeum tengchongense]MCW1304390.1 hypothetical protein [Candidatus Jingweiarchaeum tengchongense]
MKRVLKEIPLSEICLRKFEKPSQDIDDVLRKFCISIGLLQKGDSRDSIIDVLKILLIAKRDKKLLSSEEIKSELDKIRNEKIASSNVRRHLLRLRQIGIVEEIKNKYRIKEFLKLREIFENYIEKFIIEPTTQRIKEYCDEIDKNF